MGMYACACSCVEQKNVRPVKSLEIQLNYIYRGGLTVYGAGLPMLRPERRGLESRLCQGLSLAG